MPVGFGGSDQNFEPCPPGRHRAVLVDIIDLGEVETEWKGEKRHVHKVKLVWQVAAKNKNGERYQIRRTYTSSLNEKSNLRKDLVAWRGREFTPAELAALRDNAEERLIGVNCELQVMHGVSKSTGRTYATFTAILPPDPKVPKLVAENYKRLEAAPATKTPEPVYEVEPIDEGMAAEYDNDPTPF